MARRRSKRVMRTKSEVEQIVGRQQGGCAYCNTQLILSECILEEKISTENINLEKEVNGTDDSDLLSTELKKWRTDKVHSLGLNKNSKSKPAYMVLDNLTISAIAKHRPFDRVSFLSIHGLGVIKWEQYGDEITALVKKFEKHKVVDELDDFVRLGAVGIGNFMAIQAICPSCDISKKQAIRIPEGQMERISDYDLPVAEVIRLALAEFLSKREPSPENKRNIPLNIEKHVVIRERDGIEVKIIYM